MKSVPPRGSGWVVIANCQLPSSDWRLVIKANWGKIRGPTRYRVVVLTSCHSNQPSIAIDIRFSRVILLYNFLTTDFFTMA